MSLKLWMITLHSVLKILTDRVKQWGNHSNDYLFYLIPFYSTL